MITTLSHRGRDGWRVANFGWATLGHQHFWTTPEDAHELQPLTCESGRLAVVFDGRLDNRSEILRGLDAPPATGDLPVSDAALVLRAFEAWGERCLDRLLGPFAVACLDTRQRRVIFARDPLGSRTLFYHSTDELLVVASEPRAVLAHPSVPEGLAEPTLASFFALTAPEPGATFFAAVRELPPAHVMAVCAEHVRSSRYWEVAPRAAVRHRCDSDYAEDFRSLLEESVRCRLRTDSTPAVLMSGGLDSTSVAALAARELADGGAAGRLRSISWVFDELKHADEREYIAPLVQRYGLEAIEILGDDAWPLRDLHSWSRNPDAPFEGPYRLLRQRSYRAAAGAGSNILLTGEYGDELFSGSAYWLRDLLAERRWREAAGGLLQHLPTSQSHRPGVGVGLRGSIARAFGVGRKRVRQPGVDTPWLTDDARQLLTDGDVLPPSFDVARRPEQYISLLDPSVAGAVAGEIGNSSRLGVEIRRPFRDRRLVEYMMAVPAHQLYRPGWAKWLLREAMRGVLPESVRSRRRRSSLLPLCSRGLIDRERQTVRRLLRPPQALWRKYVDSKWLDETLDHRLAAGVDGVDWVVAWRCITSELWPRNGCEANFRREDTHDSEPGASSQLWRTA